MSKPATSKESEKQPLRLTLALAAGFAAGALLARRPGAALTALATGMLTCLNSTREGSGDEDPLPVDALIPAPAAGGPPVADPPPASLQVEACPVVDLVTNSPSLDPLPEIDNTAPAPSVADADERLPLALPEIETETLHATNASPASDGGRTLDGTGGLAPSPPHAEEPAACDSTRKRPWLAWM